ncbi:hypothetical protein ACQ4PT_060379 [Festuca glaucescens]
MAAPTEEEKGGGCCARWLRREVLLALALGQIVSLLITSTGFSSSELARRGINAPTSQSLLNYILLALVYGSILLYRRQPLATKWYYYLILGLIDVEANYIEGPNPLKGDLLIIFGSMLYACSNVAEEYLVKKNNRIELMAMLGLFGAVISGIQINVPVILNCTYSAEGRLMYFVAFGCTVGGLLVYSYRSSKEAEETAQVVGASDEHGRAGDEEAGMQNPVGSSVAAGNRDQISYKELPSAGSPSKN